MLFAAVKSDMTACTMELWSLESAVFS